MKYGFVLPSGDARTAADLAREAERAGWDGFFVYEIAWGIDAWVSLTAAAMQTERIRLGTMISPISRMRPWKLASETATLDNLSDGRVILSVGLGAPETGFAEFGEVTDRKIRAELMDEGLDVITGLWRGQPFNYSGKHYTLKETTFSPPAPPIQQPRIPIWVVGAWPSDKSMARALRYDGILPTVRGADGQFRKAALDDVRAIKAYVDSNRTTQTPFDIIVEGETSGVDRAAAAQVTLQWSEAGATWWIEANWANTDRQTTETRIKQGPPKFD